MGKRRTIKVDYLARVEGEGAMWINFKGGHVDDVKLKIYEPPRFFEAFMVGRSFEEAPDITARICGICPVAYQMSACAAMENALNVEAPVHIRNLRRLLYCGEWIQSHSLHIYFLHAPDFLGLESAVDLARTDKERLQKGMKLKAAGNAIMRAIGGREVHPVNVRVGGFYSLPDAQTVRELLPVLEEAKEVAANTVRWVAGFDFPEFEEDYEFVALHHPDCYPIESGRIASNRDLDIPARDYETHFEEIQQPHSNALHSIHKGHGTYMAGPMARFALNRERLSPFAKELAHHAGLDGPVSNPFRSIIVRAVEVAYCCDEAIRLIHDYETTGEASVRVEPKAATGYGCTEAPRGILYHRYEMDDNGMIRKAKIVPPTSQNQGRIEQDLWHFGEQYASLDDKSLQWKCEQAIRNYDPCISCATHFLKLNVKRQ